MSEFPPSLRENAEIAIAFITRAKEPGTPELSEPKNANTFIQGYLDEFDVDPKQLIMGLLQMSEVGIQGISILTGQSESDVLSSIALANQDT